MSDGRILVSNVSLFRVMAREAAAQSLESLDAHRTPHPDGRPGYTLRWDENQVSFKQALIAIAFSGIYLEALMSIVTREAKRANRRFVSKSTKSRRYRGRLEALGIKDKGLLEEVDHFNDARRDVIHEESYELSTVPGAANNSDMKFFVAQGEAERALKLIDRVTEELRLIHVEKKQHAP
jgi:hypothetical protein